ncbi:hypothetical protein LX36DRAFT_458777 [Colletotrichum falcatum]|nr:hypothetical protein LX36DRAFT_458777 [Colletotrichum falcatum]
MMTIGVLIRAGLSLSLSLSVPLRPTPPSPQPHTVAALLVGSHAGPVQRWDDVKVCLVSRWRRQGILSLIWHARTHVRTLSRLVILAGRAWPHQEFKGAVPAGRTIGVARNGSAECRRSGAVDVVDGSTCMTAWAPGKGGGRGRGRA